MLSGFTSVRRVNIYITIAVAVGIGVEVGDMGACLCVSCHLESAWHRVTVQCRGRIHG